MRRVHPLGTQAFGFALGHPDSYLMKGVHWLVNEDRSGTEQLAGRWDGHLSCFVGCQLKLATVAPISNWNNVFLRPKFRACRIPNWAKRASRCSTTCRSWRYSSPASLSCRARASCTWMHPDRSASAPLALDARSAERNGQTLQTTASKTSAWQRCF